MHPKLGVLMIGWEYPPKVEGGLGIHTHRLANKLAEQGVGVTLMLPGPRKANDKKNLGLAFAHPIKKEKDYSKFLESVRQYNERICRKAPRIIREKGIGLLHAHDWITFGSALRLKERTGLKLVATFHSTEFDRSEHADPKSPPAVLEREAAKRADGIIAVSKMVKETLVKRYGAAAKKISIIPNGPSLEAFPKAKSKGNVLFVGRLARQKGPEYLIGAIPKIKRKRRLVLCGDGPLRRPLEGYAKALGVARQVAFKGFLGGKELAKAYAECSIFVSPSVREPFGIALLDAMAAGKPCIATHKTGLLEFLPRGCCKAVREKDPVELAEAIEALLGDEKLRLAMGNRAKKEAKRLTWEKTAILTMRAYRKVTGRNPRSR